MLSEQEILDSFQSSVAALSEIRATSDLSRKAYLTKKDETDTSRMTLTSRRGILVLENINHTQ